MSKYLRQKETVKKFSSIFILSMSATPTHVLDAPSSNYFYWYVRMLFFCSQEKWEKKRETKTIMTSRKHGIYAECLRHSYVLYSFPFHVKILFITKDLMAETFSFISSGNQITILIRTLFFLCLCGTFIDEYLSLCKHFLHIKRAQTSWFTTATSERKIENERRKTQTN